MYCVMETLANILPILRDVATTIAASVAAYVGIVGLNAWRKQLKGKTDYDLARQYLKAVYRIRNEINKYVRNPLIPIFEMKAARKEEGLESEDLRGMDNETNRLVYARRWRRVMNATEELDAVLLEAEAVWGRAVVEAQKDYDGCIRELYATLMTFLDGRTRQNVDEDDIIYATSQSKFTQKMETAISKIEEYLKTHLR